MSAIFGNKRQGDLLLKILREGRMVEGFYDSLNKKMQEGESSVLDIKKDLQNHLSKSTEPDRKIIDRFLIRLFEHSISKGMSKVSRIYSFTDDDIKELFPESYSTYTSFLIIGCDRSRDIDLAVFTNEQKDGATKPLSEESIREITQKLSTLGYDTRRKIDINVICVDPKTRTIIASSKGGSETANIINATARLHRQETIDLQGKEIPLALHLHPVIDCQFTEDEVFAKIRAFIQYVLNFGEDICIKEKYAELRKIKTTIYSQTGDEMIRFIPRVLEYVTYDPSGALLSERFFDRYKSIVMKLLQILLWHRCRETSYVKVELAKTVRKIFASDSLNHDSYEQGALWYLFRGTEGKYCPELFPSTCENL